MLQWRKYLKIFENEDIHWPEKLSAEEVLIEIPLVEDWGVLVEIKILGKMGKFSYKSSKIFAQM